MSEFVSPAAAQPAGADFRVLRGVGPAVERRLREAGIFSYDQLAARSPADLAEILAGLVGMTPERIRQYDWAGQCALLADTPAALTPRMRYATYTIELLLDDAQQARRTRVTHVQTGNEQSWAGWDAARLAELIAQTAELQREVTAEPKQPARAAISAEVPPEAVVNSVERASAAAPAAPELRLGQLEFLPHGASDSGRLLRQGAPFDVALTLDVGGEDALLNYQALVCARNLSHSANTIVVRSRGQLTAAGSTTLLLEGMPLPPGVYRTEALVVISATGDRPAIRRSAMLEGGLVQVY